MSRLVPLLLLFLVGSHPYFAAVSNDTVLTMLFWEFPTKVELPSLIRTPIGTCQVKTDPALLSRANVVIFSMRHKPSVPDSSRPKGSLWVLHIRESPATLAHR